MPTDNLADRLVRAADEALLETNCSWVQRKASAAATAAVLRELDRSLYPIDAALAELANEIEQGGK